MAAAGRIAGGELLLRHLGETAGAEVVVIKIADGLYQEATRALAAAPGLRTLVDGTVFAAGDAMGAVAGTATLTTLGHRIIAVSGTMTRSPLAIREAHVGTAAPVLTLRELTTPTTLRHSCAVAERAPPRRLRRCRRACLTPCRPSCRRCPPISA